MNKLIHRIPRLVFLTGPAGAGKNVGSDIVSQYAQKAGLTCYALSSGDIIREYCLGESKEAQAMRRDHAAGKRAPSRFIWKLLEERLNSLIGNYDVIVINGTPRYGGHCKRIASFTKKHDIAFMIVEMKALLACRIPRLKKRTALDMREDFSYDDRPGILSRAKVTVKDAWWEEERPSIRKHAKKHGAYVAIDNNVHDPEFKHLKNQFSELFFEFTK